MIGHFIFNIGGPSFTFYYEIYFKQMGGMGVALLVQCIKSWLCDIVYVDSKTYIWRDDSQKYSQYFWCSTGFFYQKVYFYYLKPYDNPFWDFNNGGNNKKWNDYQIPLAPMGVLAPGSAHARPSALQSHIQTSPTTPQKSYPKFRNPRTTFEITPLLRPKMP